MIESFYDLLGVPSDADVEEIQRAYRQRIKETHPDLNDDPDASEKTAALVEARDVLTDEDERARYDRLGHEAYVGGEFGDGPTVDPTSTQAAASEAAGTSSSAGPTNARASAEERRRRERRATQDVDFGTGSDSAMASTNGANTDSSADQSASSATNTDGSNSTTSTRGRASTSSSEPPPWSDTTDGWAARTPTNAPPGLATQTVEAVLETPATAIVTFLLYPLLVLGAFLPAFPLIVNVIVGLCLLAMVGAAQSVAGLGVAIYGTWSVLGALGLIFVGQNPFSPIGLIVLGTTWLPLGFSVLTYLVLDS